MAAATKEDIAELTKAIQSLSKTIKNTPQNNNEAVAATVEVEKRKAMLKRRDTSMGLVDNLNANVLGVKVTFYVVRWLFNLNVCVF